MVSLSLNWLAAGVLTTNLFCGKAQELRNAFLVEPGRWNATGRAGATAQLHAALNRAVVLRCFVGVQWPSFSAVTILPLRR